MNLMDEVERIKQEGYSEANAEAKLCQDIIVKAISQSSFKRKAQMITEKLKSMMRFGIRSTRYKDVFDICYLSDAVDMEMLRTCIQKYIFMDKTIDVSDVGEIKKRAERIFSSSTYKNQVERSKKNWLDLSVDEVLKKDLEFIREI